MPEIKVSDAVAVHAAKILEKYCDTRMGCMDCVFDNHGFCQFRDSTASPMYWTVPTGFEEVGLLVWEAEHE